MPGAAARRAQRQRGATPEALSESAALLPQAARLAAAAPVLLLAAAYPRRTPTAGVASGQPLVRSEPEWRMATAIAWCPRAAARETARFSAGAQQALRWAQPAASAAPVMVLPSAAVAVRCALREAAVEVSRAGAAAEARQQEEAGAAAALRAQAGAAAGQAGAVEQPPAGAAAGVGQPWVVAGAVRRPGVAAAPDVGQQRAEQPSAAPWVFHPDQAHPWPAQPPAGRFARAMQVPRIAGP